MSSESKQQKDIIVLIESHKMGMDKFVELVKQQIPKSMASSYAMLVSKDEHIEEVVANPTSIIIVAAPAGVLHWGKTAKEWLKRLSDAIERNKKDVDRLKKARQADGKKSKHGSEDSASSPAPSPRYWNGTIGLCFSHGENEQSWRIKDDIARFRSMSGLNHYVITDVLALPLDQKLEHFRGNPESTVSTFVKDLLSIQNQKREEEEKATAVAVKSPAI